jgi:sulfur-oxidizing protein SoxX
MSKPLTSQPGDAQRGKAVAVDSNRGNCTICHRLPIAEVQPSASGDLGPSLSGVGARFTPAQLRQRIVDARSLNPETLMPAYYVTQGLQRVQAKYAGQPILTAQEVEDLVAFLVTLQ